MSGEILLNLLYLLGKLPFIKNFLKSLYHLHADKVSQALIKDDNITDIFIKGGFAKGDFVPLVSDIDFVVVCKDKGKFDLESFKKVSPLIKEFDLFSKEELNLKLQYGSLKFSDTSIWQVVKGEKPDVSYFYHPKKYVTDTIEELYFYYEHLFENLNKPLFSIYRRACARRNIEKVKKVIKPILPIYQTASVLRVDVNTCKSKKDFVNSFIHLMNLLSESNDREIYPYYKTHFDLNESYSGSKKMLLTKHMYNTFYNNGALDSYVNIHELSKHDDLYFSNLQKVLYAIKLNDGRFNNHQTSFSPDEFNELSKGPLKILSRLTVLNFNPELLLQNSAKITSGFEKDKDADLVVLFENQTMDTATEQTVLKFQNQAESRYLRNHIGLVNHGLIYTGKSPTKDYYQDQEQQDPLIFARKHDASNWENSKSLLGYLAPLYTPEKMEQYTEVDPETLLLKWKEIGSNNACALLDSLWLYSDTLTPQFLDQLKKVSEDILKHKDYETTFYLNQKKKVYLQSRKNELGLIAKDEKNNMILWGKHTSELIDSCLNYHLPTLPIEEPYYFEVIIKSENDLANFIKANLQDVLDSPFNLKPIKLGANSWKLAFNHFSHELFPKPLMSILYSGIKEIEFTLSHPKIDILPKEQTWQWEYDVHASQHQDEVEIKKPFKAHAWYKISLKGELDEDLSLWLKDYAGNSLMLGESKHISQTKAEITFKPFMDTKGVFLGFSKDLSNDITFSVFKLKES